MKDLKEYVKSRTISLSGLDDNIVERLSNLNGRSINECCGCACDSDLKCCTPIDQDRITWYYNEGEIVRMLTICPKVQDILNLRVQMNAVRFKHYDTKYLERSFVEPLYFKQYASTLGTSQISSNAMFNDNTKLYKFIEKLTSSLELRHPVVLDLIGENLQLFFIYTKGSNNGTSIKNSLKDAAKLLEDLEQYKEINWAQVLDVSIDNLDSLYDFVITITCNKAKFLENLN